MTASRGIVRPPWESRVFRTALVGLFHELLVLIWTRRRTGMLWSGCEALLSSCGGPVLPSSSTGKVMAPLRQSIQDHGMADQP